MPHDDREPGCDDVPAVLVSDLAYVIAKYLKPSDPSLAPLRQSNPMLASEIDAAHRGAARVHRPRRRGITDEPLVPLSVLIAEWEAARRSRDTTRTAALEALIDD